MMKPTVGFVSDLSWHEGIGRYGVQLQRLLQDEFDVELVYFNYSKRQLELTKEGATKVVARTKHFPVVDNK
ncbi:MAG: hypothetical protein ABIK39_05285, partial [candidate division WOR-3 bacterium]